MRTRLRSSIIGCSALLALLMVPGVAAAQNESAAVSQALFTVNNTWMLVASFLVFIMHLGFACLESGLTQSKNTTNILFKNTAIVAIGLVTYAFVGFNLMYPGDFSIGQFFGFAGFGLDPGVDGNTVAYADGAIPTGPILSSRPCLQRRAQPSCQGPLRSESNSTPFLCS